ncbi:hypothetical protein SAMN06314019_10434 [Epsilonproteobacteria bacterium SCGC AD-311-C15]|nr:hypothetical protein SAMN06314019_10434 [Epsilonproteobacteria bacterium SCGC AD-311-C15]
MNGINNLTSIFHVLIIAMFLFGLSGCGYKKAPYYLEKSQTSDDNVDFIIKKPADNNETAE